MLRLLGLILLFTNNASGLRPMSVSEAYHRSLMMGLHVFHGLDEPKFAEFSPPEEPLNEDPLIEGQERAKSQCQLDIEQILRDAKQMKPYAMKYMDSWGARPSGIVQGNRKWLGDFDQCINIEPVVTSPNTSFGPNYCMAGIGFDPNDPSPFGESAICIPDTCVYMSQVAPYVDKNLPIGNLPIPIHMVARHTYCAIIDDPDPMPDQTIVAVAIFSFVGFLLAVGLMIDIFRRLKRWYMPPPPPEKKGEKPAEKPRQSILDLIANLLFCFSPLNNFEKMWKAPTPGVMTSGLDLNVLNGIRTLSLCWVMLAHNFMFIQDGWDNLRALLDLQKRVTMQFVMAGVFAVDTFFFLSGFLGYFSLQKMYSKSRTLLNFFVTLPKVILIRWLRLTPPYGAVILITLGLWPYFSNGPSYYKWIDRQCDKQWWTNILYVNNFVDKSLTEPCVSWSWYMPVDFQLYLVSPLFIYALVRKPVIGWVICALGLIAQITSGVAVTMEDELDNNLMPPIDYELPFSVRSAMMLRDANETTATPIEPRPHRKGDFFSDIYVKPWTRGGPFVVGIIACHLLVAHKDTLQRVIFSRKWTQIIGWLITFGIYGSLIYGQAPVYQLKYKNPLYVKAIYNGFARIAWGTGLAWIVIASALKHGGFIGDFLSWAYWGIPARISYCSYLVQPMVIFFYVQTSRVLINYSDIQFIFNYIGTSFIVLGVASLLSLCFESPAIGLISILLKS